MPRNQNQPWFLRWKRGFSSRAPQKGQFMLRTLHIRIMDTGTVSKTLLPTGAYNLSLKRENELL
uniref:Uncharacterized protein n=1 Tax=Anguilla anguilla TaxID=7936 RepID=A0A0E9RIN3_ANGAN